MQSFAVLKYKGQQSVIEHNKIVSFMTDFQVFYNNYCSNLVEGVTTKITVAVLNDFLETRRADNSKYIPNIFSTKAIIFNKHNDLITYGARELLVEYLNILYFCDYTKLYTLSISEDYGFHILTNVLIRSITQILPGLTVRISKPQA